MKIAIIFMNLSNWITQCKSLAVTAVRYIIKNFITLSIINKPEQVYKTDRKSELIQKSIGHICGKRFKRACAKFW